MLLYGVNTIKACLEAKTLLKVKVSKDFKNEKLLGMIKQNGIPIEFVSKEKINELAPGVNQGIIGSVKNIEPIDLKGLIAKAKKQEQNGISPIIVILDSLTDPHNLGAVLRSCDAFNVVGVIYKKHHSVSLNQTVAKVSTGAINFVNCCEVTNLTRAIETLKDNGFWVIGLDGEANAKLSDAPKNSPLVVVVGNEGSGISRLVKENCDLIAAIPMFGHVNCLNASVACSIALYELRTH